MLISEAVKLESEEIVQEFKEEPEEHIQEEFNANVLNIPVLINQLSQSSKMKSEQIADEPDPLSTVPSTKKFKKMFKLKSFEKDVEISSTSDDRRCLKCLNPVKNHPKPTGRNCKMGAVVFSKNGTFKILPKQEIVPKPVILPKPANTILPSPGYIQCGLGCGSKFKNVAPLKRHEAVCTFN